MRTRGNRWDRLWSQALQVKPVLTFRVPIIYWRLSSVGGVQILAVNVLDSRSLLTGLGALGVFLVLFAETGLLIGFFLPGDSLLFTAGVLAATGTLSGGSSLVSLILAAVFGALVGAQVGYVIGLRGGKAMLARIRRKRVHEGVDRAAAMLEKYGYGKAIVLARFIPVVRTVLNPLAGIVGVPARTFALWQTVGGLVWTVGVIMAGYALGSSVPNIDTYLLPIVAVVVLLSLSPLLIEVLRSRRAKRKSAGI
ncbi:MAG: dedA [Amycolatopsis sp.]|nr:dedA [Amycolatopsis sp.]